MRLFDDHPGADGLRWWSTLEAGWLNVTLYDRAAPRLAVRAVHPLAPADEVVRDAARFLGLARRVAGMRLVRIGLPALIALAGVVLLVVGDDTGQGAGVALLGVALLVVLANVFVRLTISSEREREEEERNRERGVWPDED